MLVKFFKI